MAGGEVKVCKRCGKLKPLNSFYAHPHTKDRKSSYCKSCSSSASAEWLEDHRAMARDVWEGAVRDGRCGNCGGSKNLVAITPPGVNIYKLIREGRTLDVELALEFVSWVCKKCIYRNEQLQRIKARTSIILKTFTQEGI